MKSIITPICLSTLILLTGCSNMTPSEQSALSGSVLGGLGGAALGALSGNAASGAAIGAGIGAVTGAMIENNRCPSVEVYEQHYHHASQYDEDDYDDGYYRERAPCRG